MPSKAPPSSADSAAPLEETLTPAETAKALKAGESWDTRQDTQAIP
jgi:hypothetical protein